MDGRWTTSARLGTTVWTNAPALAAAARIRDRRSGRSGRCRGCPQRRPHPAGPSPGRPQRRPQRRPQACPQRTPGRRPDRRLRIRPCPTKGNRSGLDERADRRGDRGPDLGTLFRDAVTGHGDQVALRWRVGDDWQEMTYAQYGDAATRWPPRSRALGIGRGDRVALMMRNRPEFHVADVAVRARRRARRSRSTTPRRPDQIAYLIGHSGACAAIVEDEQFLDRVRLGARPAAGAPRGRGRSSRRVRRARRRARLVATCCGPSPVDLDDARRGRAAVGPRDRHLHVGHDRPAQGRDARPRQRHVDGRVHARGVRRHRRSRARGSCRTCRWRTSPSGWSRTTAASRTHYEVTTCPEPGQVAKYLPEVRPQIFFARAARLGEDPRRASWRWPAPTRRGRRSSTPRSTSG